MGEEHELQGLGSLGKKTPFYRRGEIQPLCAQPAHEWYYRSTAVLPLGRKKQGNGATKQEP